MFRPGKTLYVLDLRPYEADVQKRTVNWRRARRIRNSLPGRWRWLQAEADLGQAQANLLKAQQDVDRSVLL